MNSLPRRYGPVFLNLAVFQVAWFACVLGAARGAPGWGVAACIGAVLLNLWFSDARRDELLLALCAVLLGLAWDTGMARGGVLVYASPGPWPGLAPAWILGLWALFSTTLRGPLRWLHGRWLLSAVVGGVGGALSYAAAVRMGAGQFPDPTRAMLVLGAGWAVMTPLLVELARWLGQRAARRMLR
ncbi:DUF2878 domain-containing protein [Variovorax sp. SG517]|uniref:DUF2878 domain-containing protein n=1 Tax=unclassified Variovorax TaxID=663243 RepID=UPI00159E17EB|nr:DUF2878 domain-containing protein [Variovorax sp. SG517]NVM88881.1 hypothetical protein [Variovorax sp. SG517]